MRLGISETLPTQPLSHQSPDLSDVLKAFASHIKSSAVASSALIAMLNKIPGKSLFEEINSLPPAINSLLAAEKFPARLREFATKPTNCLGFRRYRRRRFAKFPACREFAAL